MPKNDGPSDKAANDLDEAQRKWLAEPTAKNLEALKAAEERLAKSTQP